MIASVFPGLFSYRDLLDLDLRELRFWERKAQVWMHIWRMEAWTAARMGMAEQSAFSDAIDILAWKLEDLERDDD